MKKIINTSQAPKAIGPYSQGIVAGNLVFSAGQIALSPDTGQMIEGGIAEQTMQVLHNIKAVIEAGGADLAHVIRTTVYLTKPEDFAPMNEMYAQFFSTEPPARVTVFVTSLPKNALVEIDAIAQL